MSIEKLKATSFEDFVGMKIDQQEKFLTAIEIKQLRGQNNPQLNNKFIQMKVLYEVRRSCEDKSMFNLTAQFRNLIAFLGVPTARLTEQKENRCFKTGYTIFHIKELGFANWQNRAFYIGLNDQGQLKSFNQTTQYKAKEHTATDTSLINTWEKFDRRELELLFAELQKESNYTNSFGYDLLCAAMYCASRLLNASTFYGPLSILAVPTALALNLAIFAVTIPPALAAIAIEKFIIDPIKFVAQCIMPSQYDAFIKEFLGEDEHLGSTVKLF